MNWLIIILLTLGTILGLFLSANAVDTPFYVHTLIFAAACVLGIFGTVRAYFDNFGRERTGYNDAIIRAGIVASMFWAIVGLLVGVYIALELAFPVLNLGQAWLSFGRLRPVHTSAVIFAFGGNVLICTSFHVVQRTCRARLAGVFAPWFVFWGYQLFIILAASGYVMGVTQGREYAEPEWYVDIWLTIVWVVYLLVFLGTLQRRKASGRLEPDESDRLLRLARVYGKAIELFEGDNPAALQWLHAPLTALGGASPLAMSRTEPGSQEVERLITRLEHGVIS